MARIMRHPLLRLRASLHRLRWILVALVIWFGAAALAYRSLGGLPWPHAVMSALYLEVQPSPFSQGYALWGQFVVFGLLMAFLMRELLENHSERCRLMSKLVSDHTIIVGYTHLGARLVEHCLSRGQPFVLIEKNRELVDDLLRRGEPVLIDDARTSDCLPAANIAAAKRLVVSSNNLETALIVTKHARHLNPKLKIAVRCPDDEMVEILRHLGADHVYSASQAAFQSLAGFLTA